MFWVLLPVFFLKFEHTHQFQHLKITELLCDQTIVKCMRCEKLKMLTWSEKRSSSYFEWGRCIFDCECWFMRWLMQEVIMPYNKGLFCTWRWHDLAKCPRFPSPGLHAGVWWPSHRPCHCVGTAHEACPDHGHAPDGLLPRLVLQHRLTENRDALMHIVSLPILMPKSWCLPIRLV